MKRNLEYPIKAVFCSHSQLEQELEGHNKLKDGTYLICGSNLQGYMAFYNPKRDKIILELKGQTEDDLVKAGSSFFELVDIKYKRK